METQEILDRYRYTTKAQKDEIDRLRAVNQRLDAEAEHYFRMLAAG
jgi:hypothetical protein